MAAASKKTEEVINEICERLSEGEPLRQICRDEHMPSWRSVYDWARDDKDIAARIARARELGYEAIAEDTIEIADDATNDWMEKRDKDGDAVGWQLNGDHVQRSKLRIWTRLQLLSKWAPKKYGDAVNLKHSDPDGGPVKQEISASLTPTDAYLKMLKAGQTE